MSFYTGLRIIGSLLRLFFYYLPLGHGARRITRRHSKVVVRYNISSCTTTTVSIHTITTHFNYTTALRMVAHAPVLLSRAAKQLARHTRAAARRCERPLHVNQCTPHYTTLHYTQNK
eukprot:1182125-Prorocentrum_minimum.AAC.2